MDWLKEILKGVENAQELEKKILDGIGRNFVARGDFNALNSTKKSLDAQLLQLQQGSSGEIDVRKKLEELERKIAAEKEAALRKEQEIAQKAYFNKRFEAVAGDCKWRDELTEKAVYAEFIAAIAMDANKGKEDKVIFEELTKDKNYFANPNKQIKMPGMGRISLTKAEENKMRSLMGLGLKD